MVSLNSKLLILVFFPTFFIGCASFTSGSLDFRQAISTPGATTKDSISILITQMNGRQSKLSFDYDFPSNKIQPLIISISNRSTSTVEFIPSSIPFYLSVSDIHDRTSFSPTTRLLIWSIPWFLNLATGAPIYYGILWPIIGFVDFNKANTANSDREDHFNSVSLKPIKLQPGQDIQGVVFVQKNNTQMIQLNLNKGEGRNIVFDVYPQN
jgi:hypothetical protein